MKKNPRFLCGLLPLFFSVVAATAQMPLPDSTEGDFKIANFPFQSGEATLPALTVHYTTFGKPVKDANGKTTNAILIMHGTTGNGHNFIKSSSPTPSATATPANPAIPVCT
jgi:homoserine O-acetyltransferase